MKSTFTNLAVFASVVVGQKSAWEQCGGIGYNGVTNCVNGYACTSYNPYYFQCVPGTSTTVPKTSSTHPATATTTSRITTSSSKVTTTSTAVTSPPTKSTSSVSSTRTTATSAPVATGFAKTNGLLFNIDGVTKYWAGTNCYWCGFLTANGDVDHVFADMAAAGLKIVRVWGFNDVK